MIPNKLNRLYLQAAIVFFVCCGPVWAKLDRTKYITLDEVRTEMEAYTLTVWYGTEIERFPLKILSVVRNRQPGNDMILVKGTDDRFKLAGGVQGCSGSPVYIDGRLAGALAAGWSGALEPLYLVRPIEEMLGVGSTGPEGRALSRAGGLPLDVVASLDIERVYEHVMTARQGRDRSGALPLPLATSLPGHVCDALSDGFERLGVSPLPGGLASASASTAATLSMEPGGVLAAVLCSGDINLAAVGTVTEMIGDLVYGFGHDFTGLGAVEFPMSAGTVHTVVASRGMSFKLSSPGPILGTLDFDQYAAVRGRLGVMPRMVPMRITVNRFNDSDVRTYACKLALDRSYTPMIAQLVASSAALMQGPLPSEHVVRYNGHILVGDGKKLTFDNMSSGRSVTDLRTELTSALSLLMENPFEQITPEGIEVNISIEPEDCTAVFWSARLSQTTVKPGQMITADVTLQSFREARSVYSLDIKIPDSIPAGKYPLHLLGAAAHNNFVTQNAPHRFRVVDAETLLAGLQRVLNVPRNRLYAVLPVPATGLTLRRFELPDLPPTRMLLMQDAKRIEPVEPFKKWVENNIVIDKIVSGAVQIELTVEQP